MFSTKQTQQSTANGFVRRQFITSIFASAVMATSVITGMTGFAQSARTDATKGGEVRHPLAGPLDRNDARAQLDSRLRNAQPLPALADAEAQEEPGTVEVDLATGEQKRSAGVTVTEAMKEELKSVSSSGYHGPLATADEADRKATKARTEASGAQLESLCIDDQSAVHNTWQYPWSTQVKLFMTFPNGGTYVGSGTMIGAKYVLTHQNNVYYPAFGGFPTSIEVVPGLDGYYKPFGSAYASYMRYYYHGNSHVGLIRLDRYIGNSTGWLGYGNFADSYLNGRTANVAGYPTDKDYGRVLYFDTGSTYDVAWDWFKVGSLFHTGEMGAGVYLINSYGSRYVFGVDNNLYYCSSSASRLTDWICSQLAYIINNGL